MSPPAKDDVSLKPTTTQLTGNIKYRAITAKLRIVGQTGLYKTQESALPHQTQVIVEGERGTELRTVLTAPNKPEQEAPTDLPEMLRVANDNDQKVANRNKTKEKEAFDYCANKIIKMALSMKLISVHISHSGSHTTFYFTAGQRVDFRSLIKSLAKRFPSKIEMRQIGVRDAARHLGGVGICGAELCCSTWLPEFKPISIRMAKDQNLALNHLKLSGVCGRLRCCLEYEHDLYKKQRQGLPKVNKIVVTPRGEGRVRDINVLRRSIRIELANGELVNFKASDVSRPQEKKTQTKVGEASTKEPKGRKRKKPSDQKASKTGDKIAENTNDSHSTEKTRKI